MKTITVTEAARNFSDLVSRVHYQGESALLVKGGRPMVKMTPVRRPSTGRDLAEVWPSLRHLTVAEADAFGRDLAEVHRKLPRLLSKWD
jgi:antitoxin (DNA-binding transcriptional repressor) of toxin-antitoxin stability system